ncbi:hypothetical protein EXIGLDRAFT_831776 [Exidia glandulosa HHB12029]|uniref:Homeobox domain-containing protein n=1 Tax=Exidia glandulosa HHB12029 TaxID=1314781 RepID=A0A165MAQ2_EXIGL|nr:hypothetical protein EXIGLDRAFT_831776 [Exidia glandulosa HHB12029]
MRAQLDQTIALSKAILSLCGPRPQSRLPAPPSHAAQMISAVAAAGISKLKHPRVSAALMTALHEATQSHFRKACSLLEGRHPHLDAPALEHLALTLRNTYAAMYERKVAEAASISRATALKEKQPFSTDILIYAFGQSQTPTRREREQLSALTGLSVEQVRVWFQNRRQRMKKRAPELQARAALQLDDVLARVAAYRKAADEDFDDDNDSGYYSGSDRERSRTPLHPATQSPLTVSSIGPRSFPAPYTPHALSTEFHCDPPLFCRTAATSPPLHAHITSTAELTRQMSRLTLRHRRQTPRSSVGSSTSAVSVPTTVKSNVKNKKPVASAGNSGLSNGDVPARKKTTRKDAETGRKVTGRRPASTVSAASPASSSSSASPPPAPVASSDAIDVSKPRKRLGPLRRKPAGKALARQASGSSVASTSSSDSSRSTSYSSDFSLASDSSFTSVESVPTATSMDCFQPQQQPQFDPLAAFDFTQLFSSQPSDPLPQPVADFELPPDLLAGLQMPMDTAALPPPESTDFLALLNDPTIQDLLQSVQDMDVVAPQQMQQSLTFDNTLDVGSVDTSAFLDLSASTLPTFDAMFGLDASSFQDSLWNSPGFSLPITV